MKILFIVPSYKPAYVYGGPIVTIARLAERLVVLGHEVTVYTTTANGKTELDVPLNEPVWMDGVKVMYFKRITKDHTHISPALWRKTWATVKKFDAVHIHSWWNFLVMGATLICTMRGVKPVLSPHGMMCDYVFNSKNQLKKKILHKLLGKYLLSKTHLHVSSPMEWKECLQVNEKWKGDLIFNLVDLPAGNFLRKENNHFTISFLSRIDPKKGLDILLHALSKVPFSYKLQIGGSGEESYLGELSRIVADLEMEDKVEWAGWKNNEDKFTFLAESDLFALTSHNENFALVVVESLAVGTPVLLSEHVGLSKYVNENRLGWITGIDDVEEVRSQLTAAYSNWEERKRIRKDAGAIIYHDFNETKLATDYVTMYKQLS